MSRLLVCILFLSFLVGVCGTNSASAQEEKSAVQSDCNPAYYQDKQDYMCFGTVPEKIITDGNLFTGLRKSYLSLDYLSLGAKGTAAFFENVNLPCLILKDNLFLSILLI